MKKQTSTSDQEVSATKRLKDIKKDNRKLKRKIDNLKHDIRTIKRILTALKPLDQTVTFEKS
jgi:cell division protein FtsB